MSKELKLNSLKNYNIFEDDFLDLKTNNVIKLGKHEIGVVYAPNGVGKSSFCEVLMSKESKDMHLKSSFQRRELNTGLNGDFHVIPDQIDRNIIKGETGDFVLSDNIKKETILIERVHKKMLKVYGDLAAKLKEKGISTVRNEFFNCKYIEDEEIQNKAKEAVNSRNKGKSINSVKFYKYLKENYNDLELMEVCEEELKEFYKLLKANKKDSVINLIMDLSKKEPKIVDKIEEIEKTRIAQSILERFKDRGVADCIVCDNEINYHEVLEKKKKDYEEHTRELSEDTRKNLRKIYKIVPDHDYFSIKQIVYKTYKTGEVEELSKLASKFKKLFKVIENRIIYFLKKNILENDDISKDAEEYFRLRNNPLKLTGKDELFIENIIREHMEKDIKLERCKDESKIILKLDDNSLLNTGRDKLELSTGEQNFISLSFEILKAKNTEKEFIVVDDPISSFDSIYKNKISYLLIDSLKEKNLIIFTHNLDLIKALNNQYSGVFELTILNNFEEGNNGFISVSRNERDLILGLDNFLKLLSRDGKSNPFNRLEICGYINNKKDLEKIYLISLIPFMRGYSKILEHFCPSVNYWDDLSQIMHVNFNSKKNCKKINLLNIYERLFSCNLGIVCDLNSSCQINEEKKNSYEISTFDILEIGDKLNGKENIDFSNILNIKGYKLLSLALSHSFTYLYLRLKVEKEFYRIFAKELRGKSCRTLGELLSKSFRCFEGKNEAENKISQIKAFFMSRKTLLNDFNHFESDLNIFEPALDISNKILETERKTIIKELDNLEKTKSELANN